MQTIPDERTQQAGNPLAIPVGRITHSRADIIRVIELLASSHEPIVAGFRGGEVRFVSRIARVDPGGSYIDIEADADPLACDTLLAHAHCTFFAAPAGWHIEFTATHPREIADEGRRVFRLGFPATLVNLHRRAQSRMPVVPFSNVRCVADAGGVLSFEAAVYDLSTGGAGFLVYASQINLQPGTVLKECRIEVDEQLLAEVDIEIRFSDPEITILPDGTHVRRSGCRFINPPPSLKALAERMALDRPAS